MHVPLPVLLIIKCCLQGCSVLVKSATLDYQGIVRWQKRSQRTSDKPNQLISHLAFWPKVNFSLSRKGQPCEWTQLHSGNKHSLRIHISYKCKNNASSTFQKISVRWQSSITVFELCVCIHSHVISHHCIFIETFKWYIDLYTGLNSSLRQTMESRLYNTNIILLYNDTYLSCPSWFPPRRRILMFFFLFDLVVGFMCLMVLMQLHKSP